MLGSLIKSELFRVSKMVSTYLLPILLVISVLITGVMLLKVDMLSVMGIDRQQYEELTEQGNSAEGISDSFQMGFSAGIDASTTVLEENSGDALEVEDEEVREIHLWGEGLYYYDDIPTIFWSNVTGLLGLLYLAIFAGIYIGDAYKYKFDKNLITACRSRLTMLSARIIVIAIYSFFMHVVMLLSTILSAALMADAVVMNFDKTFVMYFIITWLLTNAFTLIVVAVTAVLRSKAVGITIGVVLSTGVLTMVVTLATLIAKAYLPLPDDFSFANYFCSQNLALLTLDSDGAIVLRAVVVALVYTIICIVVSGIVTKKRDIV